MKWTGFAVTPALALALVACGDTQPADTGTANDIAPVDSMAMDDGAMGNEAMGNMAGAVATTATANLQTADGTAVGTATALQAGRDIQVRIAGMNMPAGIHGAHIHMTGACDAPTFETAGSHWNPTNAQHGTENAEGPHKGDLPNLEVAADGSASLTYVITGAAMTGGGALLDGDGAAMVIHQSADDYQTDPSGNSGDRIACGVFTRA